MLLGTPEKLEEKIVGLLAHSPHMRVSEIFSRLNRKGVSYSIQAVYKAIRSIIRSGVAVKYGKYCALQLSWVIAVQTFGEKLSRNYSESNRLGIHLLPSPGEKKIWRFTNLLRLNEFWSYLLLILLQNSGHKIILGWNPHLWFHLAQSEQETRYIRALSRLGGSLYLIVGKRNYLNTWATGFLNKNAVYYSFGKSRFSSLHDTYFNVIGDYVLTISLDRQKTSEIDRLYESVTEATQIPIAKVVSLFNTATKSRIRLEHNKRKAKQLRRAFSQFFGASL